MSYKENAVSPVIGVLLMLVVTIIIAAVVSGFAGGLVGGQKAAPSMTIDIGIKNSGYGSDSMIQFVVNSISEPIPTKDIKIITEWTHNSTVSGGNITAAGLNYPNTATSSSSSSQYQSPLGFGTTDVQKTSSPYDYSQYFGNYTLESGTSMKNSPYYWSTTTGGYGVSSQYVYSTGSSYTVDTSIDGMQAVLGKNWNQLRAGDVVSVKILHIPSGKFIFSKDVMVED